MTVFVCICENYPYAVSDPDRQSLDADPAKIMPTGSGSATLLESVSSVGFLSGDKHLIFSFHRIGTCIYIIFVRNLLGTGTLPNVRYQCTGTDQ
jgi:hypothetical protein